MSERFPDMVLTKAAQERLLGEDFSTAHSGHVAEYQAIAEAQHEADMGYKVACQQAHSNVAYVVFASGAEQQIPHVPCAFCHDTGRVTLGAIVAADRARKATP